MTIEKYIEKTSNFQNEQCFWKREWGECKGCSTREISVVNILI